MFQLQFDFWLDLLVCQKHQQCLHNMLSKLRMLTGYWQVEQKELQLSQQDQLYWLPQALFQIQLP
ncbi:MAG: hypothetical protein EBR82_57750 [Caulobacteraceae bacterium]|nr:hypothetical protein [Caulobacteraceae bacterium]